MASKPQKMPKVAKVKDKSPAEIQITAEQLLREAKERELEIVPPPPKQKISDPEELKEYRFKERKKFEDNIRKNRGSFPNWVKYAKWEQEQGELARARSVYERALDVDHRNITLWLKYAEMEISSRQINHARNIWDRAVTILPRASQFWLKYTYMEELLHNISNTRQVFERWMEWVPDEQAWMTYIKFELRYHELARGRALYERFVYAHPQPKYWIKFAHFEQNHGYTDSSRRLYERAIEFFGDEYLDEGLFIAFAKFEENQKEHERCRVIYRYALDHMPKDKCGTLYNEYTKHEKKYGDKSSIDDVITNKRRYQYEEALKEDPHNYDTWFDYVRMLEADGNPDLIREVYERAIASVPPVMEKRYWRRYIYLWIYYAVYEETTAKDVQRARDAYQMCLKLIPHKVFTFAEIWLMYAKFEIRQKELTTARKYLGMAIGVCPKHKLFRNYIELEIKLREFDRCRMLYEKWVAFDPENCKCWISFAELESMLNDTGRSRAIYELAVSLPRLDMPEYLWKSYIDFEIELEEWDNARNLYNRLLNKTNHVKVWISFAKFEHSVSGDDALSRTRTVYQLANKDLRTCEEKEQRLKLLESWKALELEFGDADGVAQVQKLMPKEFTRRRQITDEQGHTRWDETVDIVFPDDEVAKPSLLLLAKAKEFMKNKREEEEGTASKMEEGSGHEEEEGESKRDNDIEKKVGEIILDDDSDDSSEEGSSKRRKECSSDDDNESEKSDRNHDDSDSSDDSSDEDSSSEDESEGRKKRERKESQSSSSSGEQVRRKRNRRDDR